MARSVLYGGLLAVLVLLFFLRDWRSTLVIALAIPISVIATFAVLYFGDHDVHGGVAPTIEGESGYPRLVTDLKNAFFDRDFPAVIRRMTNVLAATPSPSDRSSRTHNVACST